MSHRRDLAGVTVMTVRHMMSNLSDAGAKRVKAVHNMQLCSNHLDTPGPCATSVWGANSQQSHLKVSKPLLCLTRAYWGKVEASMTGVERSSWLQELVSSYQH